jgi:hypothetical protein
MHDTTLQEMAEHLILARLLAGTVRAPTRRDVQKSLDSLFLERLGESLWRSVFSSAFDRLVALEQVTSQPIGLSAAGRDRALGYWQIDKVPPRVRWETLKRQYIVPRILGLSRQQLAGKDKTKSLIAAVLKNKYHLASETGDTLPAVVNALAWRQLNVDSTARFTPQAVVAEILLKSTRKPTTDQAATSLARLAFDTAGNDLFAGALRQWIATAEIEGPPAAGVVDQTSTADHNGELTTFAADTLRAACGAKTGWFGDNKVFISQVWNHLRAQREFAALTLAQFKERLVEAHRGRLLELSRADLVERMNADDVADSETRYLDGVFHLLRIDDQGR